MSDRVIAVGYEVNITDILPLLPPRIPLSSYIKMNVWYGESTRNKGQMKSDKFLLAWLFKNKSNDKAYIKILHTRKDLNVIIGEFYSGVDKFFTVLYNNTIEEISILSISDALFSDNYNTVEIVRLTVPSRPYIHFAPDRIVY